MASGRSRKKAIAFGLSAPALLAIAAVLVLVGVAGGIALDLVMRPSAPVHTAAPARRPAPHPLIQTPPAEEARSPSILATRPQTPAEAPPAATPAPASAPQEVPAARSGAASPLVAFAVPSAGAVHGPVLAIVIDDMGLDHGRAQQVIALPGPLTLSLMTYAPDLPALVQAARAGGHELLAHVPMEPLDRKENPGPHALTVAMDEAAIRSALHADLDGWQGYVGINNHMGSRFTGDPARMAVVMDELRARGLMWLDSKTTTASAGPRAAASAGVPSVQRDVFLDNVQSLPAIREELAHAIATAKARGTAVAIGHPHDATIAALREAIPALESRGVTLVPLTEVLKRQQAAHRPS